MLVWWVSFDKSKCLLAVLTACFRISETSIYLYGRNLAILTDGSHGVSGKVWSHHAYWWREAMGVEEKYGPIILTEGSHEGYRRSTVPTYWRREAMKGTGEVRFPHIDGEKPWRVQEKYGSHILTEGAGGEVWSHHSCISEYYIWSPNRVAGGITSGPRDACSRTPERVIGWTNSGCRAIAQGS